MQQPLDSAAGDTAFDAVYARLHQIAQRERKRLGARATLNTTALVHEAYLDLCKNADPTSIRNFYAYAARAMRNLLIDHARRHLRPKHGGDLQRTVLDSGSLGGVYIDASQALELDSALERLATLDPRAARVVELHFFAGLELARIAQLLEVSDRTVNRDWRVARAWLQRELAD